MNRRGCALDTGEIYARVAQMREAASEIGRSAARVRESIDAVENEVRAIGPDRFMSVGAEAFRAAYNRATPQLRESFDQLVQFKDRLNISAEEIENATRSIR